MEYDTSKTKEWEDFIAGRIPMKYVVTTAGKALVFDSEILHSSVVESPALALAAGFVCINQRGVHCFGTSITLGVDSRGDEDALLVRKELVERLPAALVEQFPPQK
ncbi:MAG: hypothetical protein WDN10_00255 [bacterium]